MTDAPNRPTCPWHPDLMMLSHSEWSNEGTGVVHMVCPRGCRGPGAPSPEAALAAAARPAPTIELTDEEREECAMKGDEAAMRFRGDYVGHPNRRNEARVIFRAALDHAMSILRKKAEECP